MKTRALRVDLRKNCSYACVQYLGDLSSLHKKFTTGSTRNFLPSFTI